MKKLKAKLQQFMYGRNGIDTLAKVMFYLYIILVGINLFVGSNYLFYVELVVFMYSIFRMLSKNVYRRRKENAAFVNFFLRIKKFFTRQKNKFKERKTHVYKKCPHCKRVLRLKRKKGKHTVECPVCHQDFDLKI